MLWQVLNIATKVHRNSDWEQKLTTNKPYVSIGSRPNWYQIENKTCYILKVSKFYV